MYVKFGHRQVVAVEGLHFNKSLAWRKADSGRCRSRVGADLSSTVAPLNLEWLAPTDSATPKQHCRCVSLSGDQHWGAESLKHNVVLLGELK